MKRVCGCELIIDPVENIFFIAMRVDYLELRGIEKTAAIETTGSNKVPPVLAPVGKVAVQVR